MFKRTSQLPHSLIGLVRYAGSPSLALCTTIYSVIFATQGYLSKRVQPLFYASFVLLCTERLSQEHYSCESDSHRNTIPRWQVLNSWAILEYSEAREAQSKYNIWLSFLNSAQKVPEFSTPPAEGPCAIGHKACSYYQSEVWLHWCLVWQFVLMLINLLLYAVKPPNAKSISGLAKNVCVTIHKY